MRRTALLFLAIIGVTALSRCTTTDGDGSLVVRLADVPLQNEEITGLYVTITNIQYRTQQGVWQQAHRFDDPVTVNLYDLNNGVTQLLGEYPAEAGNYSEVRFKLDAPSVGAPASEDSYLQFQDGTTKPLYFSSGLSKEAVASGSFTVPFNGTTEVVADFNSRKNVTTQDDGETYILEPTLRVSAAQDLGGLNGTFTNFAPEGDYTVAYAYEKGTYQESEMFNMELPFPNAFSADKIESDEFIISALPTGVYDIFLVSFTRGGQVHRLEGEIQTLVVDSGSPTKVFINGEDL